VRASRTPGDAPARGESPGAALNRNPYAMPPSPPSEFFERLAAARAAHAVPLRARELAESFVARMLALLFPHYADERRATQAQAGGAARAALVAQAFRSRLPQIYEALLEDAAATDEADPASTGVDEVIATYPGFYAMACYRIAHELSRLSVDLLPRLVTEVAHHRTGIDIHPGARIGRAFAIDHGTGIVIGETTVIGNRVRMYQGVTLGALSVNKHEVHSQRHPTIEDDVILYANATILGGDTVVGAGSIIGGNVWLTHSVPPNTIVTEVASNETRRAGAARRPAGD